MSRKNITSQQIQKPSTTNYLSDIVRIFFNTIKLTEHSLTLSTSQCETMPMKGSEAVLSSGTDDCAVKVLLNLDGVEKLYRVAIEVKAI